MGCFIILIALVLLVIAAAVITGVAIYNRKRRQLRRPRARDETQPTLIAEEHVASQEPQSPLVEEAEPTVAEKTSLTPVAETQAIAGEKTEPTVTEGAQPQETEEAPPQGTEGPEAAGKREPIKRGGRPRGLAQCPEKKQKPGIQQLRLKPEVVCWKRERQWVLAVELPEELLEKPGLTVHQDGSLLSQDESKETCWRLEQAFGKVTIRWNEDEALQEIKVQPGYNEYKYLLFKLRGDLDEGRLVKNPSSGSYLVIVPENWMRDDVLAGQPPVAEPVCLAGYRAHFFDIDQSTDEKIAFRLPDGSLLVVQNGPRFGLVGNRLEDASKHMGPLFGKDLPRICAQDAEVWENVRTIVVGEEGSGRGRWRAEFSPNTGQTEQHLPSELADRKGGWYFLRFYDQNHRLIDSIDFRFLSVLKDIRVIQPFPLPAGDGHKLACVELVHEADCVVQPASNLGKIEIKCQDGKTILSVPPDPTCDKSRWLVGQERGPKVEVTINVERVWWALGKENSQPFEWQDQPFTLSRNDFSTTSNKALWLRLPRHRWVDKVLVGFERSKARPYDVRVKEHTVAIPLREFGDSSEIADTIHEHRLRLWIARNQQEMEGVLAVLPSSELAPAPPGAHLAQPSPQVWCGSGRSKTAIAKAVMQIGGGGISVNGQHLDDYFKLAPPRAKQFLKRLLGLEEVYDVLSRMEVDVTVKGSSQTTMRQPKAVAHALARALMDHNPQLRPLLWQAGFGGVRVKTSKANRRGQR
ncbi:MAG: 30S ribosomal protein S9 [Candidatus Saccharicenans sp.]|nr:30S ribosomal protein S9 [Candidatus Saccharicenans sp.]